VNFGEKFLKNKPPCPLGLVVGPVHKTTPERGEVFFPLFSKYLNRILSENKALAVMSR